MGAFDPLSTLSISVMRHEQKNIAELTRIGMDLHVWDSGADKSRCPFRAECPSMDDRSSELQQAQSEHEYEPGYSTCPNLGGTTLIPPYRHGAPHNLLEAGKAGGVGNNILGQSVSQQQQTLARPWFTTRDGYCGVAEERRCPIRTGQYARATGFGAVIIQCIHLWLKSLIMPPYAANTHKPAAHRSDLVASTDAQAAIIELGRSGKYVTMRGTFRYFSDQPTSRAERY
ncbi:hypothetical protein AG1IA_08526 [Rhizoctonia solani AG-1 IA]|uniref:Uncharacterized protein n=1 Tax=Thanatephorus cucumeris (strain AG1-IA) TaxID=983506 RepID=L8WM67_THACA|nr:hypothetical protein AG1IA_08526 [Rhizoctonia solani AG-1 IA]